MKYLLDTNICIYLIKKKPRVVLEQFRKQSPGDIGISTVTVAELQYGVAKSSRQTENQQALEMFLAPLAIVPLSAEAARHYGEIRTQLARRGTPIGAYDLMIAAHARSLDLIVVTNNAREFNRVPDLRVENWAAV